MTTIQIPSGAVCGRIIRGKQESDFRTLSDDPARRVVMLVGPDGLAAMNGKTTREAFPIIGYTMDWVNHLIAQGFTFRLVTFSGTVKAKLATWRDSIEIISAAYPEVGESLRVQAGDLELFNFGTIDAKLDAFVRRLETEGQPAVAYAFGQARAKMYEELFHIFETQAGYRFIEAAKAGSSDARYMTLERYLASNRGLMETRAFLYFVCHLRELYAGDGYTRTPEGTKGLQEFIAPNATPAQIGAHEVIDLAL